MSSGHADYTPTVFEPKELQGNTWAHELAQAIVFTSPFLCMGGHPRDYLANPARDVISALPATWDETRVLPGSEPGKIAGMARRHGSQWFIGVLNGADSAALDIPLNFLGRGSWRASYLGDVPDRADAWDRREESVTARTFLPCPDVFARWLRCLDQEVRKKRMRSACDEEREPVTNHARAFLRVFAAASILAALPSVPLHAQTADAATETAGAHPNRGNPHPAAARDAAGERAGDLRGAA